MRVDEEDLEWIGIPSVRWDAPAAFAAANDMSTTAGKALLRDVLVLAHRTPRFWAAVRAGQVPGVAGPAGGAGAPGPAGGRVPLRRRRS